MSKRQTLKVDKERLEEQLASVPAWFDKAWLDALHARAVESQSWESDAVKSAIRDRVTGYLNTRPLRDDLFTIRYADEIEPAIVTPRISYAPAIEFGHAFNALKVHLTANAETINRALQTIGTHIQRELEGALLYGAYKGQGAEIVLDDLSMSLLDAILTLEEEKQDLYDENNFSLLEIDQRDRHYARRSEVRAELTRLKRDLVDIVVHLVRYPDDLVRREGEWHMPLPPALAGTIERISVFREERLSFAEGMMINNLISHYRYQRKVREQGNE